MELVLSEENFAYREDGVVDVTGRIVVPPLQWYLPGPKSALLYTSQTWIVEGQLTGKHVRGFLFYEEAGRRRAGVSTSLTTRSRTPNT